MTQTFDLLVIGGGSGGIATAVQAAQYGAKCAVIEMQQLGGTCVNLGCVPKKMMWYASHIAEWLGKAEDYAFHLPHPPSFDWSQFVNRRQQYIEHLRTIYTKRLGTHRIHHITGQAQFSDHRTVVVSGQSYTAPHIVIATGSEPLMPAMPGIEHTINSDGFFALTKQPNNVVVVGGGYIGVELAGMLNALGSRVHLLLRHGNPLSRFDPMLGRCVYELYQQQGIHLVCDHQATEFHKTDQGLITVHCAGGDCITDIDCVLLAIGRKPRTQALNLSAAGVSTDERGVIPTDAYENTNVSGIYAIGDVNGKPALTPVAIAAGRHLAARLFGNQTDAHLNYDWIPTVVFSHPPVGSVGLSEPRAIELFGADQVTVYETQFTPLMDALCSQKLSTHMKLVTTGDKQKVVGCHLVGYGVDEMLQGFAVAIQMGACKSDFDQTLAIHPTSAEELVTLKKPREVS
ncbi:MAG: glutathione-disulfide reductase [Legionellales bacterium]|nr:glutathione-disulfide reductase [Legionellales bacterium]